MHAPDSGRTHGANEWHVIVITVTITVIVLACAGVSPDWIAAAAAVLGALARK
ncbi:hypothetical protein GTY65_00050 [Streptomyces sp. SID8379]|uniref:hypothetical protein n=1 Tax=unclassified Streptomyces TaxID=2593676 RepID=UPI000373BBCC|nr:MULTISPECIES: hypothetical protein [unclassified Streptomyces]MYW62485.1 hypothetical protein [Streptomyces sp. SID8379]